MVTDPPYGVDYDPIWRKEAGVNRNDDKMGAVRYSIAMSLVLVMMLLPIKMYFRWIFNLKYFVHIQEFFLNV